MLVHKYRNINYEELWKEAQNALDVSNRLIKEIKEFLKSKYNKEI